MRNYKCKIGKERLQKRLNLLMHRNTHRILLVALVAGTTAALAEP